MNTITIMSNRMVVGFMFNHQEDTVVLIEKQKPDWQKGLLNGVGGKIESHESPIEAIAREFKEETGVDTPRGSWLPFAKMEGDDWEVWCFCMFSDVLYKVKTMEEEKVGHYSIDALQPEKMISNIPALIELAQLRRLNDGFNVAVLDYRKETI